MILLLQLTLYIIILLAAHSQKLQLPNHFADNVINFYNFQNKEKTSYGYASHPGGNYLNNIVT